MIREPLVKKEVGKQNDFHWRGTEVLRIEGFSDAVFAFALTLLVVSLEVPKTFNELLITMKGFAAFAICFALLTVLWYEHYSFFRRYAMEDTFTIVLNSILLFVVLFYVYPLKFVFTLVVNQVLDIIPQHTMTVPILEIGQSKQLMIVYGVGYVAVFLLFGLLYYHALRRKTELNLTEIEIFDTKTSISGHLVHVFVASLSVTIAIVGGDQKTGWSGLAYFLLGPSLAIHGMMRGKQRRKYEG